MILLLANEGIVGITEIKSFIRIDPVMRYRKFLKIMIAKYVPRSLLKGMKAYALIARIDVITVGYFVAIENGAATAATMLHRTEFRLLMGVGSGWGEKKKERP